MNRVNPLETECLRRMVGVRKNRKGIGKQSKHATSLGVLKEWMSSAWQMVDIQASEKLLRAELPEKKIHS